MYKFIRKMNMVCLVEMRENWSWKLWKYIEQQRNYVHAWVRERERERNLKWNQQNFHWWTASWTLWLASWQKSLNCHCIDLPSLFLSQSPSRLWIIYRAPFACVLNWLSTPLVHNTIYRHLKGAYTYKSYWIAYCIN